MTTLLRAPGNNPTPRAVVRTAPGMVALDATCVTPAVRWYTLVELEAVNGKAAVKTACKTPIELTIEPIQVSPSMTWHKHAHNIDVMAKQLESDIRDCIRPASWRKTRYEYKQTLNDRIEWASLDFDVYPRDVFLGMATYLAHMEAAKVDQHAAAKSARMIMKAIAEGQLPEAA